MPRIEGKLLSIDILEGANWCKFPRSWKMTRFLYGRKVAGLTFDAHLPISLVALFFERQAKHTILHDNGYNACSNWHAPDKF